MRAGGPPNTAGSPGGCPSRERRRRRATTPAAPSAPADVPTKPSHSRASKSVASCSPTSIAVIHASPRMPPPPSTSTSGRLKPGISGFLPRSSEMPHGGGERDGGDDDARGRDRGPQRNRVAHHAHRNHRDAPPRVEAG